MNSSLHYQEFNNKILKFYLDRTTTEFINLSLDEHEFSSLFPNFKIQTIKSDLIYWNRLLYSSNTIPQYFGLIGLQCYAAYKMQKDENYSPAAYKIRLQELLGIKELHYIQSLFEGEDSSNPVQEKIWFNAKKYFFELHGLTLTIPPKTKNAGRYVQYPKSQSLLNTEDLKSFTIFFSEEFRVKEEIPYKFFRNKIEDNLQNIDLNNRAKNLFEKFENRIQCLQQIYNYFNKWEGEVFLKEKARANKTSKVSKVEGSEQSIILRFEYNHTIPVFSLNGIDLETHKIFDLEEYKYFHFERNFIIFNEHEYYPNEFEDSRFFYTEKKCYVLTNQKCNARYEDIFNRSYSLKHDLPHKLTLFKIKHFDLIQSVFKDIVSKECSIKLLNGVRINRKKQYIKGYGPTINCNQSYQVFYNHEKVDYHYSNSPPGIYKIRVQGEKDVEFKIVEVENQEEPIHKKNIGWNLENFSIQDDHDLQGIGINLLTSATKENLLKQCDNVTELNPLREWIMVNNKRKFVKKHSYKDNNVLLKILKHL